MFALSAQYCSILCSSWGFLYTFYRRFIHHNLLESAWFSIMISNLLYKLPVVIGNFFCFGNPPFTAEPYLVILQSKTQMLDNLLEIEVAYSMLKTGDDGGQDPLDVHYTQLKTDIKVNYYV